MSPTANQPLLVNTDPVTKGSLPNFTPETRGSSFLHKFTQYDDGHRWGRNLVVYAISVAITYGFMVVATEVSPHDPPKLPLLRDWAVGFAFWISLPAILFFIASDQDALKRAMIGVETAGIVVSSKESAKSFKGRWQSHFRAWNIAIQIVALAAIPLSYGTYALYTAYGANTWAQATALNRHAYMWGIALFYFVLFIYIGRGLAMAMFLKSVASVWEIKLNPVHPDGCGGLRPLGRIGLRNQYALTILGINIAVLAATIIHIDDINQIEPSLLPVILIPAMAIYVIFGPIIFLGPLLPFRRVMGDQRRALMQEIAEPLELKFEALKVNARNHQDIKRIELDALDRMRRFGQTARDLPVWPFDSRTMRLFATAYAAPVLVAAVTKLAEVLVDHVTT
jgi:hypothetical protein